MKKLAIVLGLLVFAVIVAVAPTPANAAVDVYLKIDGIDGESTDKAHKDWIIIESASSPVHAPDATPRTTQRIGDAVLEDFVLVKKVDKASPKLSEAVCKGRVFPKVEIHMTASYSDAGRQTYYTYELTNARVTSYSVSARGSSAGDMVPVEEFSLNFEEVKVSYASPMGKGRKGGNAETTWKVEKGE